MVAYFAAESGHGKDRLFGFCGYTLKSGSSVCILITLEDGIVGKMSVDVYIEIFIYIYIYKCVRDYVRTKLSVMPNKLANMKQVLCLWSRG